MRPPFRKRFASKRLGLTRYVRNERVVVALRQMKPELEDGALLTGHEHDVPSLRDSAARGDAIAYVKAVGQ